MFGSKLFGALFSRRKSKAHAQALTLTVHSLPPAASQTQVPETRRGRWKMLFVMLVCAAPVLASYFAYYVVRPEGRRSYGELIVSQRPLPDVWAKDLTGQAVNLRTLHGQWLLVSVAAGACDAACARRLYLQRQLRTSLGPHKDRVDWVWLISDEATVPDSVQAALQGATVLRVPLVKLDAWLAPGAGRGLAEHIYLVDPMGNWMLRFPPDLDLDSAKLARRDLERLLRAAASWDHAGRLREALAP
jgi:hypothetical protein